MEKLLHLIILCACLQVQVLAVKEERLPNIVVLLADDLGIGDLGCFGNETVLTPNIDRLCREGVKMTHHMAAAAVCTPSRAAFLTGRHAHRSGMDQAPQTVPVIVYTAGRAGLPANETTWAKMLQNHGYRTAAIGKWHLGWDEFWRGDQVHGPLNHGFDYYFGLPFTLVEGFQYNIPFFTYSMATKTGDGLHGGSSGYGDTHPLHNPYVGCILSLLVVCAVYNKEYGYTIMVLMVVGFVIAWFFVEHFRLHTPFWWRRSLFMEKFLNSHLMENTKVVEQPIQLETLTPKLTKSALNFLDEHQRKGDGQPFSLFFSFPNVHTPLVPSKEARGKSKHSQYGDSLYEMDLAIGRVLDKIEELGETENTLIYFTSDHGCHINIGNQGGSNRPFRGGKGINPYEGAFRVPGIVKWPGVVKPGSVLHTPTSLMDFLPTIAEILKAPLPSGVQIDGESFLSLIKSGSEHKPVSPKRRVFRHYCGISLFALRIKYEDDSVYKAVYRSPVLNDQGHCGPFEFSLCPCFGPNVTRHDPPILYDILSDPEEQNPLKETDGRHSRLLKDFQVVFEKAESEWIPPSEFKDKLRVLPMPWLQPCARFPFCKTL